MIDALSTFGLTPGNELGHGGEARVFALSDTQVLRLFHEGATLAAARKRGGLFARLRQGIGAVAFDMPAVLESGTRSGRVYSIETRLAGISLDKALAGLSGTPRARLLHSYFDVADQMGDLAASDTYEELEHEPALRSEKEADLLCGLLPYLGAMRKFLAAYWLFARNDDANIATWAAPELGL